MVRITYNLTLKTPPTTEPLSLTQIKDYLKISDYEEYATEDTYLTSLITVAWEFCESFQNRAYITQVWEMAMPYFPGEIEIPKGNLQSIGSITYKNSAGVTATLAANTDYVTSTRGILGRVVPAYGKTWPSFVPFPLDAIVITFTCGYGGASDVPEKVIQAMKLLVSHWFNNRVPVDQALGSAKEVEFTISALLWQDRIVSL